jgi:uncharacterized protein (TIGR03435 family)
MMVFPALPDAHWMMALVNHLWQSTCFLLAIWLLTILLRQNQARTRYRLWMLASLKFLVPFSILMDAGGWLHSKAFAVAAQPALTDVMWDFAQPFSAISTAKQMATKTPQSVATAASHAVTLSSYVHDWPFVLLAIWIGGVFFVLLRWSRQWRRIHKTVQSAVPMPLAYAVPVRSTRLNLEPGIFGILRPVLLLPEGIQEQLSDAQLDAVIAHELCHVRRHDNLTAACHTFVEAIFWFYPAVWWVKGKLLEERERACDEAVLESSREATTYAEGILNVCKLYMEAPVSCVSGVTGSELKKRIVRILGEQATRKLDMTRKALLFVVALLVIATPITIGMMKAAAQTAPAKTGIEDTWQGTLHLPGGKDLRTIVKVIGTGSAMKATLYSLDQGGQPIPSTSASFENGIFKYAITFIDGSYEGKMSADGKSIAGIWKQGPGTIPLVLERATPATEWVIPEPAPKVLPMAADAHPTFEVATIKPSKPDQPGKVITLQGTSLKTVNTTVVDLIEFSYNMQAKQIVNAPDWISTDKFDIDAKPDTPGMPSVEQMKEMIQKLLTDRLQMKFHREKRELSAYVLSVGKGGHKLTAGDPNGLPGLFFRQLGVLTVNNATMEDFCGLLQSAVFDRPVVDQTGLQGRWGFLLKWTPDESQFSGMGIKVPPPSDAADAPPPIFTALQEQIGLKLESTKAPVPTLVLDHLEKPSAN